ncbi:hypothetical protein DNTS_007014 [Danionella cerebrum]|uniref:Fatty acid 2-hydroxylase n=1 Tax=Danionella cerebrum TaxID=2873325 RepID=A0A553QDH0_9TELE|nr:hypothetical protein DNTS_007014 [Danionella translucida]
MLGFVTHEEVHQANCRHHSEEEAGDELRSNSKLNVVSIRRSSVGVRKRSLASSGHPRMNPKMSPSVSPRFFSEKEVAKHCTKDSCWVLLGTRVYDVTAFLRMHPGGEALILRRSGRDISREIEGPPHRHSENARRWMEQYYIGELDRDSSDDAAEVSPRNGKSDFI